MEIGEAVALANESFGKEKCPFCNKDEHPWPEKKKIDIDNITSKPRSLGCGNLSPQQSKGNYGRASHHMIPVNQCYKRIRRLAEMGQSVGYDINGGQNGIPLPTVWNPYNIDGTDIRFSQIEDSGKKDEIRWAAMKKTGAQWHVGHHHYDVPEDMSDEGELDHQPYDEVVLRELLKIADKAVAKHLCETDDQSKVKAALDKLCKEIEGKLNAFKGNPSSSYPYYVSKSALVYVGKNH